jgi:hypothetical protein
MVLGRLLNHPVNLAEFSGCTGGKSVASGVPTGPRCCVPRSQPMRRFRRQGAEAFKVIKIVAGAGIWLDRFHGLYDHLL